MIFHEAWWPIVHHLHPYLQANWCLHSPARWNHKILLLPWPAKSADLSPIENHLAQKVELIHPHMVPELKYAFAQALQGIKLDLINNHEVEPPKMCCGYRSTEARTLS